MASLGLKAAKASWDQEPIDLSILKGNKLRKLRLQYFDIF